MAKKIYRIENLDCANCAAKAEARIQRVPGVREATITFATMQLRLTAEDPDALLPQVLAAAREVEPDIRFLPREGHEGHSHHTHEAHGCCGCGHDHDGHHHDACGCGHDHDGHHHDAYGCEHGREAHSRQAHDHHAPGHSQGESRREMVQILAGAGLFAAGLVLEALLPQRILHILVFLGAYLVLGWEVLKTAGKNLVRGKVLDENFLMSLATLGAVVIGDYPEAVGVMLFYRVGEYFEEKAVARSRSQIMEAVDLRPEVVNRVCGGKVRAIPAGEAQVGDLLLVRPGDRIPLDGVVVSGTSRVDTAPITGEPVPVSVEPGSRVTSGCVNTSGQLTMRVEKPLSESMVTRILDSVENAAASKPKMDRFITRFSRIYTPVVVALAACTAVIPPLLGGGWNYWIYTALSFLVMSCPCALVLSVPLAFFSGIGAGSKQGILFKGGLSIEALARVKAVVMDKTGTVTKGDFSVQEVEGGDGLLRLCAGCEQRSTHPIAASITAAAKERGLDLPQPEALEEIPGHGIRGVVEGKTVLCGNRKLMERFGLQAPEAAGDYGTRVWVAVDGRIAGFVRICDTLKPGAKEAVGRLNTMGITTAILTGDDTQAAEAVASQIGVKRVYARLLPDEKLQRLQSIREESGAAMFVGDGINDAPVLSGADVGAAMGSGADAAIEAADVVFMTSSVDAIPESLDIARKTQRIAWQNVVFALAVKAAVMVLGLLGRASMWAAVFADSGVAMLCVLNSVRMLYRKK